jgi:hypothetical protein
MTKHLNELEIIDYLKEGYHKLPIDRRAHLDECDYCKQVIKDQSEVNAILSKMKLLKAPAGIYNTVSRRIINYPVHRKDWFFYITLVIIAVIAMLLFFDFGNEKVQKKSVKKEQVKDFIQKKMSFDELKIEETTVQVYHNFISVMKEFSRSTYGSTIIFVILVILFYLFVDQQFLRKKLNH